MNILTNHGIDLSVTVNGRPTRTYLHEGKYFIESREGTEYAIEIKNNNWYRVEVVGAVDGLSVITGKPASATDSGYIVNARDKIVIKGFRKDKTEVGAFKFTKKEASYAASKGEAAASNVGVIAIAVYAEKPQYTLWCNTGGSSANWVSTPLRNCWRGSITTADTLGYNSINTTSSTAAAINGAAMNALLSNTSVTTTNAVSFDHGTTWGAKIEDRVVTTTFDRGAGGPAITEIFYNSKENLEAIGIKMVQEKQVTLPRGFPSDFAEPPAGWKG